MQVSGSCPHGSPVNTPCLECAADAARGYCSRCHGVPHQMGACEPPTVTVEPLVLDVYVCSLCGQGLSLGRPHICHMTVTNPPVSSGSTGLCVCVPNSSSGSCGCPTDASYRKGHVAGCPLRQTPATPKSG